MNQKAFRAAALCVALCLATRATAEPTVGVYYYPWWGAGQGGHTFDQTLRAHLTPNDQLPAAGDEYSSRDANVISSHIDQSHLGNISMWSMSWWGPNRYEDITIRNHILTHPRASELNYTIHYESTGRLGDQERPGLFESDSRFPALGDQHFQPSQLHADRWSAGRCHVSQPRVFRRCRWRRCTE